jgi:predicted ATPase
MPAPYLRGVRVDPARVPSWDSFPFDLPFVRRLDLELRSPVTFFVGENGSGKSTLLEAIASLLRLPVSGGGRNDLADASGPDDGAPLARALRTTSVASPSDLYFFRSEHLAHFAELLDRRARDPDFIASGDPYARYGGRTLHSRSHGEAFLTVLTERISEGLFLLDEPEAALSPQRQLALLARMWELVAAGRTQFIVATHAPVLMTFPGATIVSFDGPELRQIALEETTHHQITTGVLAAPERYWRHLRGDG